MTTRSKQAQPTKHTEANPSEQTIVATNVLLLSAVGLKVPTATEAQVEPVTLPYRQDTSWSLTYPKLATTMCWVTHVVVVQSSCQLATKANVQVLEIALVVEVVACRSASPTLTTELTCLIVRSVAELTISTC